MHMRKFLIITCFLIPLTVLAQSTAEDYWRQAQAAEKKENYSLAINLYKQCKAATEDKFFKEDCDNKIKALKQLSSRPYLTVPDTVTIPYTGEFQRITINSNPKNWNYRVIAGQLRDVKKDGNQLLVVSQATNRRMEPTTATIRITAGTISKNIQVIQEASPEFLHCSSKELTPSSKGEKYEIDVDANYENWTFSSDTTWFKTRKVGDKLIIEIAPNNMVSDRADSIIVKGKDISVTILINQRASDEKLSFSQNSLWFPVDGESRTIAVYTNADHWFVGNSPEWCHVEKISQDSLRITTFRNTSDNIPNEASVYVTTGLQSLPIRIFQDARPYVPEFAPMVGGRNISFGLSFAYSHPFVSTSAGSDFIGSVINYGLCNKEENAAYYSSHGFLVGVFTDIRLHRTFFLNVGLNYNYYTYKNRFEKNSTLIKSGVGNTYMKGDAQNAYLETYRFHFLEIPILASYRVKLTDASHIQINLGPVIGYGLCSELNLSGNTHCESLYTYSNITGQKTNDSGIKTAFSINSSIDPFRDKDVSFTKVYTINNDFDDILERHFSDVPFNRFNCGLRAGIAYEIKGVSFGLSYTFMLTNMAKEDFWSSRRWYILNSGEVEMSGYSHRVHSLNVALSYTFRYK